MSTVYPSNVDSFTTKVDSVTDVLAEHVNTLQEATVAIETKLGTSATTGDPASTSLCFFLENSAGAFRNHIHDGSADDGATIPMSSLSEVALAGVADKNVLKYSTASSKWVNGTIPLSELSDVTLGSLSNGEALVYNSGSGKWINQSLAGYALLATTQSFTGLKTFAGGLVVENRTSDPTSPVAGQLWFRTDV